MTHGGIRAPLIPNPQSPIPVPVPALTAIVDADAAAKASWPVLDLATAFLNGGARFLQLRAKRAGSAWFLDVASAVVDRAREAGARVIVNDRADLARLAGADGVHVGQDDLAPAAVRRVLAGWGDAAIVGLSTHTIEQIEAALDQPVGYLAIGPVFVTSSKVTGYEAVGLERVRLAAARASTRGLRAIAIGGITLETAPEVLAAGAASVAVISDLLSTGDPEGRIRAYVTRLAGLSNV